MQATTELSCGNSPFSDHNHMKNFAKYSSAFVSSVNQAKTTNNSISHITNYL